MEIKIGPPRSAGISGRLLVHPSDRAEALLRASEAAAKAAALRERGDEFAALVAEMHAQASLRTFAALNEHFPGGIANQDPVVAGQ